MSNTTIHDSNVLVNNILIMLETRIHEGDIMIVCPCTKYENTYYSVHMFQYVYATQTLVIY